MTKTSETRKRNRADVSEPAPEEVVLVVDVATLEGEGFYGTSEYKGQAITVEFDDRGLGLSLTQDMAARIGVRKGSKVSVAVESEKTEVFEVPVSSVGRSVQISDPDVYRAMGQAGGAVLRLRHP